MMQSWDVCVDVCVHKMLTLTVIDHPKKEPQCLQHGPTATVPSHERVQIGKLQVSWPGDPRDVMKFTKWLVLLGHPGIKTRFCHQPQHKPQEMGEGLPRTVTSH